ncbi:MAG: hypothetical protein ACRED8_13350 [Caulobacteraceae bacterium]
MNEGVVDADFTLWRRRLRRQRPKGSGRSPLISLGPGTWTYALVSATLALLHALANAAPH